MPPRPSHYPTHHTTKKRAHLRLISLLLILSLTVFLLRRPTPSQAAWFDDTYAYRQKISFTHTENIATERRITLTIDTSTLITSGKLQSDCDDTRFTNSDGKLLRYQLVSGCNTTTTTYYVIYPGIKNGTNYGYIYYGHPNASTGSDTYASSVTALTSTGGTNGGPTKVDDPGDPGTMLSMGRQVVRTSTGSLFSFFNDGGSCELWLSVDGGTTWNESDAADNPTCITGSSVALAIDSTNTVHMAYYVDSASTTDVYWTTFSTATSQFAAGTVVADYTDQSAASLDLAIDSNNIPHAIWIRSTDVIYSNRVGGSWDGTPVTVSSHGNGVVEPSLAISEDNIPEISFKEIFVSDLYASVGNQNDATSFTNQAVDTSTAAGSNSSIAIDSSGNSWISYVDASGAVTIVKHNDTDAWSTWQSPLTNSNAGTKPTIAIVGTDIYVFYQNSASDVAYDKYNGSWSGETTLQTGTFQDVKSKWAYYNDSQQSTQIDYLYSDATDISWASLTLSAATTFTAASEERGPSPVSYWSFDEGYGDTANDSTIQNNDLDLLNTTWKPLEDCVSDRCLYFNGIDSSASKSYVSDIELDTGSGSFTISAWFRHPSDIGETNILFARATDVDTIGYKLYMNSSATTTPGAMCFGIDDNAVSFPLDSACSATSYADSTWHNVVGVKDGTSSIKLYMDGKLAATDNSITSNSIGGSQHIFVGIDGDGALYPWKGYIDEIKYYNFAKSAAQIKSEFTARSGAKGSSTLGTSPPDRLTKGLVSHWKLDESASPATDATNNNNSGTWQGSPSSGTGKYASSLSLNGSSQYVSVTSSGSLQLTGDLTLSAWVYRDTASQVDTIVDYSATGETESVNHLYNFGIDASDKLYLKWEYAAGTDLAATSSTAVSPTSGAWTHYAVTRDTKAKSVSFYQNGKLLENPQSFATNATGGTSSTLTIGRDNADATDYLDGRLDELRIYNRALTQSEIEELYTHSPGPVAHWNMDEGSGTTTRDLSSQGKLATLVNNPTWSTGKFGGAVNLDGTNDYLSVANPSLPTNDFTYSAWIYLDSNTDETLFSVMDGSSANELLVYVNSSNKVQFQIDSAGTTVTSTNSVNNNQWTHISVTRLAGTMTIYINGQPDPTTGTDSDTLSFSTCYLLIGVDPDNAAANCTSSLGNYLDGKIDDVRIYNYARTPKQVVEDMNAGHPAGGSPIGSQAAYWKLDELTGTIAHDTTTNAKDLTLTSAGWASTGKLNGAWDGNAINSLSRANEDTFNFSATDSFSITTWFQSDSASNPGATEYLVNKSYTVVNGYSLYANTSGQICIAIDDDATWDPDVSACSTSDLYDKTWHHIAGIRDVATDQLYLYVDGKQVASTTDTTTATLSNSLTFYLGDIDGTDNGSELTGNLDEVKLYRFALTPSEILIDANANSSSAMGGVLGTHNDEGFSLPTPVGWWKLDDNTGTTAVDSSGKSNTGTLVNGPTWTSGKIGSAISFDGANDYVTAGTDTSLDNLGPVTYTAWIYPTGGGEGDLGRIVDKTNGSQLGTQFMINNSDVTNGLNFSVDYSTTALDTITTSNAITLNTWQHVAVTWDDSATATNVHIYVNGIEASYGTPIDGQGSQPDDNTGSLIIGNRAATDRTFAGKIDDVRVYNSVLTQTQIAYLYNRGSPQYWYKLDECSGNTIYNSSPDAQGLKPTGTGATGTITIGSTGTNTTTGSCSSGTSTEAWNNGTTGKYSSSLDFDGTDDYIDLGNINALNSLPSFSVETWVNTDTLAGGEDNLRNIVVKEALTSATTEFILRLDTANDDFEFYTGGSSYVGASSTTIAKTNTWYHLLGVYDGSNVKLYVNGKLEATSAQSGNTGSSTRPVRIGNGNRDGGANERHWSGQIDNIRIYTYSLNASQVQKAFNEGSAVRFGPSTGSP